MTNDFKELLYLISLLIIYSFGVVLFIPTLGHSLDISNKLTNRKYKTDKPN